MPNLRSKYLKRLNQEGWQADAGQEKAVQALGALLEQLKKQKPFWPLSLFSSKDDEIKGVYLYGGVGRGKSMLMDLFYEALPTTLKTRRVHFHEFMIETHDWLHQNLGNDMDDLLTSYADNVSERTRVLCFDEFHVTDVADAMILGRLFTALFESGVIVVSTSNWAPDNLYEGGLQRELFLPFIALLKTQMNVVHLDSDNDYRMLADPDQDIYYFHPLNAENKNKAQTLFDDLSGGAKTKIEKIEVKGRTLEIKAAKDIARLTFSQLCETALGAEDYIKIAQKFDTVFLEDVPHLSPDKRNEAKRFILLIDCLYEARCRLIITAENDVYGLYDGGRKNEGHAFEFDRTISRLMEMQSMAYHAERVA